VNKIIDEILADYADNPDSADAIYGIGDFCRYMAMAEHAKEASGEHAKTGEKVKNYYAQACSAWEHIINDLPESEITPKAYHFAGECHGILGQTDKMVTYYQKVLDTWPDYSASNHLQMTTVGYYENLKRNGQMSVLQADPIIKRGYENLANNYPDWPPSKRANVWLDAYNKREKGAQQ